MNDILSSIQKKYIEGFNKKPDPLIQEMEEFAEKNQVPILSRDSSEFLEFMIEMTAPKRVLEIGTAIGYSSIRIARNLKKKSKIHTIEKSSDNVTKAKEFIAKSGNKKKIKILSGDALDIMPELTKKYNFIFLDADKEDYLKLFEFSVKLLKKGGVIFVDNLLWHGYAASVKVPDKYKASTEQIREFNKIFMDHKSLKTMIIPLGDGIGLGLRSSK